MKRHLPNLLTLTNLFCGCIALVCVLEGEYGWVPLLMFIALMADFADGMVARALQVSSPLGKELDSLADVVSFGVVPGAILFKLLETGLTTYWSEAWLSTLPNTDIVIGAFPGFILSVFAALRLAKFNIDTRQQSDFIGLATPACTVFIFGLLMIYHHDSLGLGDWILHPILLYGVTALFSYLMIAEIPMFSMKFKGGKWKGNEVRILFALTSILLLVFLGWASFAIAVLVYLIFAVVNNVITHE